MPDVILVRVKPNAPPKDYSLKTFLVYKFINECGPFKRPYLTLYTYLCKPPLYNRCGIFSQRIAHIGENRESEGYSVFIQQPIAVGIFPTCLFKKFFCLPGIIFIFFYIGIIRPCIRDIRPCCRASKPEQNNINKLALVYCVCYRLPYTLVLKKRMFKVKSHIGISKLGIAEFLKVVFEKIRVRLLCILYRRQPHHIYAACLKLKKHC